jgi:hypothetical protein
MREVRRVSDPKNITPRIIFRLDEDGGLSFQLMSWWERPGLDDVHIEGRSHYLYSSWHKIRTIGVEGEIPEVVLDRINEMAANN